jgi:integrase
MEEQPMNNRYDDDNKHRGVPLVTDKSREYLNPRQEVDYREFRRNLAEWLHTEGKNPGKIEGYSQSVVETTMNRLDLFFRFVWDQKQRYTTSIGTEEADQWITSLAKRDDISESSACHYQKAAHKYFKYLRADKGRDIEWEPTIEFSDPSTNYQVREYLTREERTQLREAAMDYETIPHYNSLSPEERTRWKKKLAQRLQKPASKVTKQDFLDANSFKYPSMIYLALDIGARPIEINRMDADWLDLKNGVVRIPKEDAAKNREDWICPLKDETVRILDRWLEERNATEKYDGKNALWLTKYGNRYDKDSFRTVFRNIAEEAGFDLENRDLSLYSIRHSTGNYAEAEGGLATAAKQLRHKSKETTKKYSHSGVEQQRDTLNRLE